MMMHGKEFILIIVTFYNFHTGLSISLIDKSEDFETPLHTAEVQLTCKFQSNEEVSFKWELNGRSVTLRPNQVYVARLFPNMKSLVIKNFTRQMEGTYTCIGTNSDGTASGSIKVSLIRVSPKVSELSDLYLKLKSTFSVSCMTQGFPLPSLSWSKQNGIIDGTNIIDYGNGTLKISSMRKSDEGRFICSASNSEGGDTKAFTLSLATSTKWLLKPGVTSEAKAGDSLTLEAQLISMEPNPSVTWFKDSNSVEASQYNTISSGALYTTTLSFGQLNVGDAGNYQIFVESSMASGLQAEMNLIVFAPPDIKIGEGKEIAVKEGEIATFICMIHAYPKPIVQWQRNGSVITPDIANQTQTSDGQRTRLSIIIEKVVSDDRGIYTCFASNSEGNGTANIKLVVEEAGGKDEESNDKTILIVIIVISIIVVILIVALVFVYCKFKETWFGKHAGANGRFYTDLVQEEKDASCLADIENNPFAIKKNINISIRHSDRSNSVSTTGRLFSQSGKTNSLKKGLSLRNKSLKMSVKSPISPSSDYAPLDTVICQGKAIDFKRIIFDEMLGTGEYGLANTGRIIDNEDPTVYKNVLIKMLKEDQTPQHRRDMLEELRMMRRISKHPNVVAFVGWCITDDNVYIVEECPHFGSLLTFLRSNRSLSHSTESLDQLAVEDRVDEKTLLSFAWQIAFGMKHLASLQIVHRDLACRNVYLGHEKTCKISEYGLSRDIYAENVYRCTTGGQLPVRWMAYEAVFEGIYTTQSDVWSFGILLWELITLGKIPYPGIVRTEQLLEELESGYHMENPGHISTDLYLLMNSCWNREPETRPTFDSLQRKLGDIMNTEDEVHIDLDKLRNTETQEYDEPFTSPTDDCHRPPTFSRINEEEEDDGIDNSDVKLDEIEL